MDKNQACENPLALATHCLCLPAWEYRQDPIAGIPGAGSLACFGCQLPSIALQKAPAPPRCQEAVPEFGIKCNRNAFTLEQVPYTLTRPAGDSASLFRSPAAHCNAQVKSEPALREIPA